MFSLLAVLLVVSPPPAAYAADPAPVAAPVPPTVADAAVVVPTFSVGDKKYTAGTAFFVKIGDQVALFTSHALLGPGGGLPRLLTAAEVAGVATVTAVDAWNGGITAKAGPGKVVADAATVAESPSRDLAVFAVSLSGFDTVSTNTYTPPAPLAIATVAPKVGDIVWLAANAKGSPDRLHAAKVGEISDLALYVDFAEQLDLVGTSGAPFVNAKGEVVGMMVGGGVMEGIVVGAANPAASLVSRAGKALGAK